MRILKVNGNRPERQTRTGEIGGPSRQPAMAVRCPKCCTKLKLLRGPAPPGDAAVLRCCVNVALAVALHSSPTHSGRGQLGFQTIKIQSFWVLSTNFLPIQ
ncbi:hypothetical protein PIB30_097146 [Stylosanthes scabra]|uniref:Uncharacterized protein n=1 Tax=Stylosanthes scabra TaxID=79078 RepID=A0ABU6RW61_9FABA|nr:hypothetical protein [Stylosanthes scabra]